MGSYDLIIERCLLSSAYFPPVCKGHGLHSTYIQRAGTQVGTVHYTASHKDTCKRKEPRKAKSSTGPGMEQSLLELGIKYRTERRLS
jgi:hypothetical protein